MLICDMIRHGTGHAGTGGVSLDGCTQLAPRHARRLALRPARPAGGETTKKVGNTNSPPGTIHRGGGCDQCKAYSAQRSAVAQSVRGVVREREDLSKFRGRGGDNEAEVVVGGGVGNRAWGVSVHVA